MKTTCNKRAPYNQTLTVSRSHEIKYPHNVHWGRGTNGDDTATITFKQLMDIYTLDLDYSFTTCQGSIQYQKIGCPIGGYLSAFYANTVCAYHEWQYINSLKQNHTKIYGIRQMDDLLVWIAMKKHDKNSHDEAIRMKQYILQKNGVYKGGLELEEEHVKTVSKHGQSYYVHDFAGVEITIRKKHPTAISKTLNKSRDGIKRFQTQTKIRYPPWLSYTSKQSKRGVIIGTLHRTAEQNTTTALAVQSMLENYEEYKAIGYPDNFYTGTLRKMTKVKDTKIAEIAQRTRRKIQTMRNTNHFTTQEHELEGKHDHNTQSTAKSTPFAATWEK